MIRALGPRRIAAQLTALVVLSAVIFHLCMSGAFFLNRVGGFRHGSRSEAARFAEALATVAATPPEARATVLAALARAAPDLDLRPGPATAPERRSVVLTDGTLLNVPKAAGRGGPDPSILLFGTLIFVALSTTLFLLWALRSITAPLSRIAAAVDGFAPDGILADERVPPPLAEDGPLEVATLARGFNRMRSRIARMMADRTEMLAAVSHDLRTPITRLRLRAEFLQDAALRELMLRDLKQMDALVHSALAFIRDRAVARTPTRLDLASLLRTVCDEAADLGTRVRYEGPDHLVVEGHEDDLRRAVANLIDNAARVEAEVVVRLARDGDGVSILIEDDGPGIPPERLGEVMRPFRRGPEEDGRAGPSGFGLGLPIVQAIVAAHGGTLALTNREPHGLRCAIALPAAA